MFTSDDNFQLDAAEIDESLDYEEFQRPAAWELDDFRDILRECGALREPLQ
jgi:hypothetical protein